jgi:hypothetical protein
LTGGTTRQRIDAVLSLAKAVVMATAATLALATAATAQPQPPNIPNDIPTVKTARFKMTIHGMQHSFFAFSFTLNKEGGCPLHAEGQISEDWEFARGRGTVLVFTKFPGGLVTMRREGRGLGDAAFAAPGGLVREANGFYDLGPYPCGGSHNFGEEPTCGQEFEVNSDLRLQWLRGSLVLQRGATRQVDNPAAPCGEKFGAIDLFTTPFPLLTKQKAEFTKRQIFGKKRGFRLKLKARFLEPEHDPVYDSVEEKLNGESDLTLKRLKND